MMNECPQCGGEDVSNTNPTRSPFANAEYRCPDCGADLVEDEPGCGLMLAEALR